VLVAAGAFVVGYVILAPFLSAYVLTHSARAFVPTPRLGAKHEEVSFTTADGLRLQGWYVPSRNGAAVISFPGRKGTQKPARLLARHGYGVLLFDRRGEGGAKAIPTAGDGRVIGTSTRQSATSGIVPTSSLHASAASDYPWAAR
jgi:uncharacterized protein